ncbi:MAG: response regulator [Candidatus Omnitrophica bacterium]|nr:response regulator [Candidatus Omnitrophota bacterium]
MLKEVKKIFILDDDQSVRRSLSMLLGTYGFIVDVFSCAEDFFNAVPDSVTGCLILDIHMPGTDGWAVLERIVKSGVRRPVIIISADKREVSHERAIKTGAIGYLHKPFISQALVDLIQASC